MDGQPEDLLLQTSLFLLAGSYKGLFFLFNSTPTTYCAMLERNDREEKAPTDDGPLPHRTDETNLRGNKVGRGQ